VTVDSEYIRQERAVPSDAREHLLRIARGDDDRYDFAVTVSLHASRSAPQPSAPRASLVVDDAYPPPTT
jgi:hypothetical protein